ncbi:hypothetical protein AB1Y20_002540 [Prymnesium parvum]|uniref:Uncharacterized protein n=1 Tax=Prymnesium parvum TaxID=97485 RepID=A0AB34JBC1_PRYPA
MAEAGVVATRMGLLLLLVTLSFACRWAAFGSSRLLDRASFARVAPAVHGELLTLASFAGLAVLALELPALLPRADVVLQLLPLLTMAVAIHLLLAVVIVVRAALLCASWDVAENISADDLAVSLGNLQLSRRRGGVWTAFWADRRIAALQRIRAFQEVRGAFLTQHGLYAWFPFARYVRACMNKQLARLTRVHWSCWLLAVLLTLCRDLVSWHHCDRKDDEHELASGEVAADDELGMQLTVIFTSIAVALATIAIASAVVRERALTRLVASLRYWVAPVANDFAPTRGGRSTDWLSPDDWRRGSRTRLSATLTRERDGSIHYAPPSASHAPGGALHGPRLTGTFSWVQLPAATAPLGTPAIESVWAHRERLRCESPLPVMNEVAERREEAGRGWWWCSCVELGWRRLRWAPSVFLASSKLLFAVDQARGVGSVGGGNDGVWYGEGCKGIGERGAEVAAGLLGGRRGAHPTVAQAVLFGCSFLIALLLAPIGPTCGNLSPLELGWQAGNVAPIHSFVAVCALPLLMCASIFIFVWQLPSFSLVTNVALRTDTKVLNDLQRNAVVQHTGGLGATLESRNRSRGTSAER